MNTRHLLLTHAALAPLWLALGGWAFRDGEAPPPPAAAAVAAAPAPAAPAAPQPVPVHQALPAPQAACAAKPATAAPAAPESDGDRLALIHAAASDPQRLPDSQLQQWMLAGASDRVRLAALEAQAWRWAREPLPLQALLVQLLQADSPVLQREARQLLDEQLRLAELRAAPAEP